MSVAAGIKADFLLDLLPHVEADLEVRWRKDVYLNDPVAWAEDFLGLSLWSKQREILYSIRDNRKTAVAAGHGVGKSFVAAVAMAWWVDVHPLGADESGAPQTFVASTAPFADQITAILWNNIRILHALAAARHKEYRHRRATGLALGDYAHADHALPGYVTGDNKWKTKDGLLIGQGRKPPDNKTDSGYQGLHATYLLAIGDEAAGLSADMIDALGNITTGEHNRMLLIANPTDPTSAMALIWKKNLDDWARMHISVFDSPRVTKEEGFPIERAGALSGLEYINERRAEWGEEDPRYISRVLGQWAFDAGNNLITDEEIAKAVNAVVIPDPNARPRQGWDIARMGADFTVGYQSIEGEVWETSPDTGEPTIATGRRGHKVRLLARWSKAPLVGSDPENPGSATRINDLALAEGATLLVVDATGMGGGVVDGLRDFKNMGTKYDVLEYYASGASTDKRTYINARVQHYFGLKDAMRAGVLDLESADETLIDELRGVQYDFSNNGARKMESKDEMRKRGVKSPDFADALVYATADVTPVIEGPLGGLSKGDVVQLDPWTLLGESRLSSFYPL